MISGENAQYMKGALSSTFSTLNPLRPFFRRFGVVAGAYYDGDGPQTEDEKEQELDAAFAPWGFARACGRFKPVSLVREDDQNETGQVAGLTTPRASIWDLEALIRRGFDAIRNKEDIATHLIDVDGPEALAWLTPRGANIDHQLVSVRGRAGHLLTHHLCDRLRALGCEADLAYGRRRRRRW